MTLTLTLTVILGLMEAHEIGTDASMATHVSNVIRRGYVTLDENTRSLVPSALGLALIHRFVVAHCCRVLYGAVMCHHAVLPRCVAMCCSVHVRGDASAVMCRHACVVSACNPTLTLSQRWP